jgi:methionine-rich copper-binding protein CopC
MTRKTMATVAAISVLGAGLLTASTAFAQSESTSQNPMDSLVQKIAQKFNLNEDEVQAVFDEAHKERHAQMKAGFEERLSTYVSQGKITEEQKQLILQKHEEMEAEREANKETFRNLSKEERRSQMESKHAELEAWAKENGIDLQYLMMKVGRGHRMGEPVGFGQGKQDHQTIATPTITQ